MVTPKQLRLLATRPSAYMRYLTTGRLPQESSHRPSPLELLLSQLSPRDLAAIRGLTIGPSLGYQGRHVFPFAAQALRWLRPESTSSERAASQSWRDQRFSKPLYLEDLASCCVQMPTNLAQRYPKLRKPLPRGTDRSAEQEG